MIEQFSFPLNVYARLLELQEGRCDYLHFAVFDRPDEPVLQAQERASELLWQVLPPPCRLLEVGIGLGTTLARLQRLGYDAVGITPEAEQIRVAQARQGGTLQLHLSRLEDFDGAGRRFDALLFQESGQYIAPLELFTAADRLLVDGPARLVVMDEFALDRRAADHGGLHHLEHFIEMARRFGWTLADRLDLSQAVQPTARYLIDGTRQQRDALLASLPVTVADLDGLDTALQRVQRLYAEGVHGYARLCFTRTAPAPVRPVRLAGADAPEVRALFGEVFGHELSAEEWAWKYGHGRGVAFGLRRGSRLLAHYGGLTRAVWMEGERVAAAQVCDVIVHPELRGQLGRRNALQALTASFLEAHIGWGLPNRVGFGFPTQRAFRVAERLGLYAAVDQMWCASWTVARSWRAQPVQRIDPATLQPGAVATLALDAQWQAMRAAFPRALLGERDAAWVRHRYGKHPRFRYELWQVSARRHGPVQGYVVLRRHEQHLEWVDWIGVPEALPDLLRAVRQIAVTQGIARVESWITASHKHLFDALAPTWRDLAIDVPANVHSPGPLPESLRGRWLLTAGDTDFR